MTITIKHYGITYSIEKETEDLNAVQMIETLTDLMRCIGFHPNSIDGAIMELNEQIDL